MLALQQQPVFRASARLVVVPATVFDPSGKRVLGLQLSDFIVLDQGQPRDFQLESMDTPVTLILAVETSAPSAPALARLRKSASLFDPLLAGHAGRIGLVTYDSQVRVASEPADDSAPFEAQLRALDPGDSGGRMLDAVAEAATLLQQTPPRRRRVVLIVGESKDLGSKSKLDQVVARLQEANITVYPVTYSRTTSAFTSREPVAATGGGADILGALRELGRLGQTNTAAELARHTGGAMNSFTRQRGLEDALQRVGEDLHLQYVLSFEASGVQPGIYRSLSVTIAGRPELTVRHRPGYWIPTEPTEP